MSASAEYIIHWLSIRVRLLCLLALFVGSLLPPYFSRAALAPPEMAGSNQQFLLVEDGFLMKSSSLSDQTARLAYSEGTYHTVKEGESLEKLMNRYNITKDTIMWANELDSSIPIQPGQELLILPVDGVLHTVSRGQTLLGIAELYEIPIEDILQQNSIKGGFILTGQRLIIPGASPLPDSPTVVASTEPDDPPAASPPKPATPKPTTPPATPPPKPATPTYTPTPSAGQLQKPCSDACFITQYFHAGHFALDMQERGGGPIYAADDGTVVRADYGWNGGYGNVLEVDHGNELVTLYAHNKSLLVDVGDTVKRGQKIADMGNTGLVYGQTGIHVHFEVRFKGVKKNPLLYIQ